MSITGAKL